MPWPKSGGMEEETDAWIRSDQAHHRSVPSRDYFAATLLALYFPTLLISKILTQKSEGLVHQGTCPLLHTLFSFIFATCDYVHEKIASGSDS